MRLAHLILSPDGLTLLHRVVPCGKLQASARRVNIKQHRLFTTVSNSKHLRVHA